MVLHHRRARFFIPSAASCQLSPPGATSDNGVSPFGENDRYVAFWVGGGRGAAHGDLRGCAVIKGHEGRKVPGSELLGLLDRYRGHYCAFTFNGLYTECRVCGAWLAGFSPALARASHYRKHIRDASGLMSHVEALKAAPGQAVRP